MGSRIQEGTLTNISNNGGFFTTRRIVELGTWVQVRFRHPWTQETVTSRGIVMRDVSGAQAGLGIAMLDSLSDLEENPDPTSGTFSTARMDHAEKLTSTARTRGKVQEAEEARITAAVPRPPSVTPAPAPPPALHRYQMRPARYRTEALEVSFFGAGRQGASGTLSDISSGGLQIRTTGPTDLNRLVRLEIMEKAGATPLRIAGKVTWSNPQDTTARKAGFGVRILHFLSAQDERRWDAFLEEQRIKNNSGAYARPG